MTSELLTNSLVYTKAYVRKQDCSLYESLPTKMQART